MNKTEEVFNKIADKIIDNKQYLTKLDSAIGDGDHGINMARGFSEVKEEFESAEFDSNSAVVKKVAMTLISNVGGASGPLYGTAFLQASKVMEEDLSLKNAVKIGEAVIEGIKMRGKAEQGDKTMLDAIIPAVNALKEDYEAGVELEEALQDCLEAAEEGKESTIPLVAKKGRASYLGERSKGHQDPGATSSYMIIETIIKEII
ncbi:dihydroxyacetone kinase subunit DhaL [Halanaerobacter jeridensis]|uniref:phosphoenolpyruvate--glycerone phosphotransferase n=1 Tax=Halanaerobacter jeridensis TaxID=706427 RepID=A0A938XP21_9FIRM|nr:dihydroxyacetone kinase subunit DhaL [Halanaerobacter jeridensis]MBM7556122.1 dihydroxyacetone kinase-like protein [Halanaerobacter jeridensis]